MRVRIIFIISIFFIIVSCNKEHYYEGENAVVKFSTDTVSFDTIFTSFGSATQRLKVYNPYDKILRIASIKLAGDNSHFILNINGIRSSSLNDIDIYPKDSLFIFIQVFVNPVGSGMPLLIRDSILFTLKDHTQNVKLLAYGQDVHVLRDDTLKTTTWDSDKPYLLFGNILVDTLQKLTIEKGTTIFFHKNANLIVKGSLIASGEFNSPVSFRGERLEKDYRDIPGQWGSLIFLPGSSGNIFNWVIIENGTSGIYAGNMNSSFRSDFEITNSIIRNMSYNSLFAINSRIRAANCVIADAANYACGLIGGGDYEFYHCTIANHYGSYISRGMAGITLKFSNFFDDPEKPSTPLKNPLTANFYNSIIYGANMDEISIDSVPSVMFSYKFDHCLLKSRKYNGTSNGHFIMNIWNKDPKFVVKRERAFQLDTLSPAKDYGNPEFGIRYPYDLLNVSRTSDAGPDLGAYERIEKK